MYEGWTYNDKGDLFRPCGKRCSYATILGYRNARINGKNHKQHRIIFYLVHGYLPEMVDHIDRIRDNNAPTNLRGVTCSQNLHNTVVKACSKSGIQGVQTTPTGFMATSTDEGVRKRKRSKYKVTAYLQRLQWENKYDVRHQSISC